MLATQQAVTGKHSNDMKREVAKASLIIGGTRVFTSVIGLASNIILARLLSPADFGLVAIAGTVMNLVISVTEVPTAVLLLQLDTVEQRHYDTAWTIGCIRTLAISMAMAAMAMPLSLIYHDERLTRICFFMAFTLLLGSLRSPRMIEFNRQLRFDVENKILAAQRVVCFVVSAAIAYYARSYWALLIGTFASDLVASLMTQWYARHRPRFSRFELGFFLRQGMWLSLTQVISSLNNRADPLLVGYFVDKATLGRYSVGANLAAIPTRETLAPLTQPLLPSFALMRDDVPRLRSVYLRSQALLFAVATPTCVGVSLLAHFVVVRFLGPQWQGSELIIQVLAVLGVFSIPGTLSSQLAVARGENRMLMTRTAISFVIRGVSIVLGFVFGGFTGCLVGICAAVVANVVLGIYMAKAMVDLSIREQIASNLNTFIATAAMAAVVLSLQHLFGLSSTAEIRYAVAAVLIGAATYTAARFLVVRLRPDDSMIENEVRLIVKRLWANR